MVASCDSGERKLEKKLAALKKVSAAYLEAICIYFYCNLFNLYISTGSADYIWSLELHPSFIYSSEQNK